MADEENVISRKTFQYCYLRWVVKNFSLLSCLDEYEICCPEFSVNYPEVTKWKFGLRSTCTGELGNMSIYLERQQTDGGPEIVLVNWKAVILKNQNSEHFSSEYEGEFPKNKQIELELLGYPEIKSLISGNSPDELDVRCDLIVDHDLSSEKQYDPRLDPGLRSLSDDLKRLYHRGIYYDLTLRFGEADEMVVFRVHRAILLARNVVIFNLLQDSPSRRELKFSGVYTPDNGDAVNRVLCYLYNGDVNYIIKNPTIPVIRFAEFLAMEEIEPFFKRHEFSMVSEVSFDDFEYGWVIEKFAEENKDYICSDLFTDDDGLYGHWRLHLFTRGVDHDSNYMDLFLEYVHGPKPLDIVVNYTVLDLYDVACQECRVYGRVRVTDNLSKYRFFRRDKLAQALKDDEFRIFCDIQVSFEEVFSTEILEKEEPLPPPMELSLFYSGLASNVKKLFFKSLFTDVILKSPDRAFGTHKSILAVRSKTLSKILRETKASVVNLDIKGALLHALLRYIYNGELTGMEDLGFVILRRMYETALYFRVPALKELCSKLIKMTFAPDTIGDILELAENAHDEDLKAAALSYICESQNEDGREEGNEE